MAAAMAWAPPDLTRQSPKSIILSCCSDGRTVAMVAAPSSVKVLSLRSIICNTTKYRSSLNEWCVCVCERERVMYLQFSVLDKGSGQSADAILPDTILRHSHFHQ